MFTCGKMETVFLFFFVFFCFSSQNADRDGSLNTVCLKKNGQLYNEAREREEKGPNDWMQRHFQRSVSAPLCNPL